MRVLVVSGIWPPDVGGPASHAPEVAGFLRARGHEVEAITADAAPAPEATRCTGCRARCRRASVMSLRAAVAARARRADVVYTTGMFGRSSLGALLGAHAVRAKLTADPAFERARRRGLVAGEVERVPVGRRRVRRARSALARDADVRRAAHIVSPSAYLRELAVGGASRPSASPCCRTRRRVCPSCGRATSSSGSASTARCSRSPAA